MSLLRMVVASDSLFWFACIPSRLALAYIVYVVAYSSSSHRHRLLALLFALMGIGMLVTHLVGRSHGSLGQPAWWASLRPLHASIWLSIAACLFFSSSRRHRWLLAPGATLLALADVAIGVDARGRRARSSDDASEAAKPVQSSCCK